MNNKKFYEIRLEDYSFPRYMPVVKSYYGTWDDITELVSFLSDDNNTSVRYREIIEAAESYNNTNLPVYNVAGHAVPVLTPVQEVARFETQLANQRWNYQAYDGDIFPCLADTVAVCQNLIRAESEYIRCLQVRVTGFRVCYQGMGWVCPTDYIKGFPGTITWVENQYSQNLFVAQQHYNLDELAQAMADMTDTNRIDLSVFSADMIGVG